MKRRYPDGPKFNLAMVAIAQMFPKRFPFDALAFALDLAQQYGDIAYYSFGPLQVYYLNHPDLVRQVAVEQADRFYKPRLIKYAFRPFAGQGLLTNDGDSWKQQRKLMQPAFHARTLTRYGDSMVEHTQRMLHSFADGEVRDMGAEITQLTLGIVVKTLFGSELPRPAAEIGRCMLALIDAANQRVNS